MRMQINVKLEVTIYQLVTISTLNIPKLERLEEAIHIINKGFKEINDRMIIEENEHKQVYKVQLQEHRLIQDIDIVEHDYFTLSYGDDKIYYIELRELDEEEFGRINQAL